MSAYSMHITSPVVIDGPLLIDPQLRRTRYFIEGQRVSREVYWDAAHTATRRDTFHTHRRRKLWVHSHVAYNPVLPKHLRKKGKA